MDPVSQAVAGAALAGVFAKRPKLSAALALGALAGMAPDLDVLIRSPGDPLLSLEYHRHFTHSLAFAPIGALLCALGAWILPWFRRNLSFVACYGFCFLGFATHGLLDSCTGYGTHLLWPFTDRRESWDIIGIIDLFFTLPALILLITSWIATRRRYAVFAACWMLAYLSFAAFQHQRVQQLAVEWLGRQEAVYSQLTVRPTISNLWLWRVVYRQQNTWHSQAFYVPFWGESPRIKTGESVPVYQPDQHHSALEANSVAAQDLARFRFFSDSYVSYIARDVATPLIADARYAMLPDSMNPLWGVTLNAPDQHVNFQQSAGRRGLEFEVVKQYILGGEGFEPLK